MKHILFPTVADADAFIADLKSQGVIRSEVGTATLNRSSSTTTDVVSDASAGAEDAGAGAVKGTGVGALVGAAAGVLGAGAVVATGGLALPVILGMTALGAGVGAGVGAVGGAAGIDENADGRVAGDSYSTTVDDHYYDHLNTSVSNGGRAVAVDDNVPADVLSATMARHNGHFVSADSVGAAVSNAGATVAAGATRTASAAGDVAQAAGNKVEEGADRLRAVGHEIAGAVTGNPKHDALAAEDRAKADMNNAQARADMNDADRKV